MRREDDVFYADLLLSPGRHRFQIYRNGKLASQKVHSLRCVRNVRKVMPFDMVRIYIALTLYTHTQAEQGQYSRVFCRLYQAYKNVLQ